jgi:hypothetical protein
MSPPRHFQWFVRFRSEKDPIIIDHGVRTANPKKLGKLNNHDQEPWKLPLPEFLAKIYSKRFGKARPDAVRSIEETAAAKQAKKLAKKATRDGARRVVDRRDDPTQ